MNKIESALSLASEGYFVFPIKPGTKEPAHVGWQEEATRDQAQITEWWQENPNFNPGIFTGRYRDDSHLLVVDVDVKDGKGGKASWDQLCDELGLQLTRQTKTPSGGRHFIYATDQIVRSRIGKVAPGIDIKSSGGYVVGPGSTFNGKDYTTDARPIEQACDALVNLCGRPPEKQTTFCELGTLDLTGNIETAKAWLRDGAPSAIQGRAGDETTYKVAAHLKDLGLSEEKTLELMADEWNKTKADPPWEHEDLAVKVSNAYQYGDNAIGSKSAQAEFDDGEVDPPLKKPKREKVFYLWANKMKVEEDRVDLIRGYLSEQAMSVIYGDPGSGKTFVALKMAYCIATGKPFANHRVEQGPVAYVAAEAGGSIDVRIAAFKTHYGVDDFPMAIFPCPVDLLRPDADTNVLIKLIKRAEKEAGHKVKFVVIDTLSRALAGGNENAPDDMGAFVTNIDTIRHVLNTHLCIVHHSGKDRTRGARGHSLLRAGIDTELEVVKTTELSGQVKTTKQRDREHRPPLAFELIIHKVGTNRYGEDITSCVLEELEAPADADFDDQYSDREQAAIDVLVELTSKENPVDIAAWKEQLKGTSPFSEIENAGTLKKAIQRVGTFLGDMDLAVFDKQKQMVTYVGDKEGDSENG